MTGQEATSVAPEKPGGRAASSSGQSGQDQPQAPRQEPPKPGFFTAYKPEQGRVTRRGTMVGVAVLVVWGAWFAQDRLLVYQGDEWWRLLITPGIPILMLVVLGAVGWRVVFASRGPSDFMIATEGEMKKVSWSSKREVIGSTKVVIMFTVFLAAMLFAVDLAFQMLFRWMGVLKV